MNQEGLQKPTIADVESVEKQKDPFEGIDYFDQIDAEAVEYREDGKEGEDEWSRTEFFPRTGEVRILRKENGELSRWTYNLRIHYGRGPHGSLEPEEEDMILARIKNLHEQGIDTAVPKGYPEVTQILQEISHGTPVSVEDMRPGSLYLAHDGWEWKLFEFKQLDSYMQGGKTVFRILSNSSPLFDGYKELMISESDNEPTLPSSKNGDFVGVVTTNKERGFKNIYEIDQTSAEKLLAFKPAAMDFLVGTGVSRESFSTQIAVQGLQYERWGADEVGGERYEGVNRGNYQQALEALIARFGKASFAEALKKIIDRHLQGLHTEKHHEGTPYKPHSDISPRGFNDMRLAKQVVEETHPVSENMIESGFVVNVKSIFGDADFWVIMRDHYPDIFNELVDYIEKLPRDLKQVGTYANATLDPIALIRQYFPEAHQAIVSARPDFVSDTPEAILIQQ